MDRIPSARTFADRENVAAVLAIIAIVGLALLPSPGIRQHPGSSVEITGTDIIDIAPEAGPTQAKEAESAFGSKLGATARSQLRGGLNGLSSTLVFCINFVLWILLAMAFNAFGKAYLRATANPVGLVVLQGVTGVVVLCSLGRLGVLELRPGAELTASATRGGLGVAALCHASQALFTNFAVFVGGVAVTNALKAMEPVAAAVLSYLLLGKRVSRLRSGALVVVVCGILLLTSNSKGGDHSRVLLSAVFTLAAVCANALRNVIIKRGSSIPPHQTLLACSAAATAVGLGVMLMRLASRGIDDLLGQGCQGTRAAGGDGGSWVRAGGVNAALCYVGFQLASFNILAFLSPLGHAVGNSCKRVLVFGSGIVFLGETMDGRQLGGTAVALLGVLVYGVAGAR